MKAALLALYLTLLTVGCSPREKKPDQVVTPTSTGFLKYEDAVKLAKSQNKVILVDVFTDWCEWCKKLDENVYPDSAVKLEMGKYFAATKLNAESSSMRSFKGKDLSEQQIASIWHVASYPTILFLSPDEEVITKIDGYTDPKEFAMILRFVGTGGYKNSDYDTWKKANS